MLQFPFDKPEDGAPVEIADGLHWVRFTIPYVLNHVNIYLLRDGDGWLAIDTCIDYPVARHLWTTLLERFSPLNRLLLSHFHIDHTGAAGWLHEQTGCQILMSPVEYALMERFRAPWSAELIESMRTNYLRMGCGAQEADELAHARWVPTRHSGSTPRLDVPLLRGDEVTIGKRRWRVMVGRGHSPDGTLLYCADERLLVAGDTILPSISPFIGVDHRDPRANPLQDYLDSLQDIEGELHDDALVLPGHGLPFRGVRERLQALHTHHEERNERILAACRDSAKTVREIALAIFNRNLDGVMGMAMSETMAHVNWLIAQQRLSSTSHDGQLRLKTTT
ncbi:MAG TPA: MBL fold metallo-hydrolase [Beijerinckiaceae bacterium]|nr:MBL fold metallo-hydrolase [Beijerinckiaceae bacterium]